MRSSAEVGFYFFFLVGSLPLGGSTQIELSTGAADGAVILRAGEEVI